MEGIIAPGIDWPVAIAARVAARFGLAASALSADRGARGLEAAAARAARARRASRSPRGSIATEAERGLPVPCVVKPPDRQGQKGLTLVRDASELAGAVALAVGGVAQPAARSSRSSSTAPR